MLGGDPPFTGSSAQAVLARHRLDSAPSLSTIRQAVPPPIERAVMRALQKSPADRYATAEQFAEALSNRLSGEVEGVPERPRKMPRALITVACVAGAVVAWWALSRPAAGLDANKVVVFPLTERGLPVRAGTGQEIALMIGSALEHTEPLKWIDGWTWLTAAERADVSALGAAEAAAIARQRSARYYVDGAIVAATDSSRVILRLNDAQGDSVVSQVTAAGVPNSATIPQLGLRAINLLLPRLLEPGRQFDLTALAERRPAAIAQWLQGERAYRRGDFDAALLFLRRAVAEDSLLAVAALRGAQAASWKNQLPEATQLARVALAHLTLLPERQVNLARGLAFYLDGQADSAVHWLGLALRRSPDWAEAHMALGEVYHHLLPSTTVSLDTLASQQFVAAARDTGFAPPRFHLAEIAIRSHDLALAKQEVLRFGELGGGSDESAELDLMLACLERGRGKVGWREATKNAPLLVLGSTKMLSVAGAFPGCAEDGSRALRSASTDNVLPWGAFFLLANLLAAGGRDSAIVALVESVQASGRWQATTVYLMNALAGTRGFEAKANEAVMTMAATFGPRFADSLDDGRLLLLGTWFARTGRIDDARRLHARLVRRAIESPSTGAALYGSALAAHLLLAHGDSVAALLQLERLAPVAQRDMLAWGWVESLPIERLTRARLLCRRQRYQEALTVASAFDHPTPIIHLAFLPASLALRYRAAQAMGRPEEAAAYQDRLVKLGRTDLLTPAP